MSITQRLNKYSTAKFNGCIIWTGATTGRGYGCIRVNNRTLPVHRVAYELKHGPIPAGLYILHSCNNPLCINTEHLRVGTQADNMADRSKAGRSSYKYVEVVERFHEVLTSSRYTNKFKADFLSVPIGTIPSLILQAQVYSRRLT